MSKSSRIQLRVLLSYRQEPRHEPRIRRHLEHGYRILDLQRLSDHEAIVTLEREPGE